VGQQRDRCYFSQVLTQIKIVRKLPTELHQNNEARQKQHLQNPFADGEMRNVGIGEKK
jgi:hypothetical protein